MTKSWLADNREQETCLSAHSCEGGNSAAGSAAPAKSAALYVTSASALPLITASRTTDALIRTLNCSAAGDGAKPRLYRGGCCQRQRASLQSWICRSLLPCQKFVGAILRYVSCTTQFACCWWRSSPASGGSTRSPTPLCRNSMA